MSLVLGSQKLDTAFQVCLTKILHEAASLWRLWVYLQSTQHLISLLCSPHLWIFPYPAVTLLPSSFCAGVTFIASPLSHFCPFCCQSHQFSFLYRNSIIALPCLFVTIFLSGIFSFTSHLRLYLRIEKPRKFWFLFRLSLSLIALLCSCFR